MKERVYHMECASCGHQQFDNIRWIHCLRRGCKGKYKVIHEFPAGV